MELTLDQALQKGVEAHKAGKAQEADRYYTAILKAQPKHPDANHNMGVLAVGVGKVQEALPFFKAALEVNPSIAQYWLSYIDALVKLDQIADAKLVFEQAKSHGAKGDGFDTLEQLINKPQIEGGLTDEEVLGKAEGLRESGKYDEAINLLLHQTKQSSTNPNILALLSHCYMLSDNLEKAKISLGKAKNINPKMASVGWNESRLLLREKKVNEALAIAEKTNKLFPDNVEGMGVLGSCFRLSGSFDESLKYLNKAIELNPNYAEALINRGLIYLNKKDKANALTDLEKAHKLKPHLNQIWHLVLSLKMEANDFENTISLAEEMVKLDPVDEKIFATIALCYHHLNNYDDAVVFYEKALSIKPDYAEVYNDMGNALKDQSKLEKAIEAYTKALSIKPDYAEVYSNMGNALKDQSKLEKAIEAYTKALSIKSDYAEVYSNMGNALKDLGKLDEAIEAFKKALSIKPDYADGYNNMGNALQEQGKLEEAIEAYNKALSIKPDYAEASKNMALSLYQIKKYKEAASLFRKNKTIKSQTWLLKCLYELNNKSHFFDQLDFLISNGENNAIIGSYTSRSKIRYGIYRENPFCDEPLKYVQKIDLLKSCDFQEVFVKGAVKILNEGIVQKKRQSLVVNGNQTAGNVFGQMGQHREKIQDLISRELEKYRLKYKDSSEGLISNWPTNYYLKGWIVKYKNGGAIKPHMHERGWISGSVYINVPPKLKDDSGNLVVCIESETDQGTNSKSIDVVTGSLCLFPSSLLHYTIPFESNEDRIVLAFDMVPNK